MECCQLVGVPSFMHAEVSVSEDSLYGSRYAVPAPLSLKAISRLMGAVRWDAAEPVTLTGVGQLSFCVVVFPVPFADMMSHW